MLHNLMSGFLSKVLPMILLLMALSTVEGNYMSRGRYRPRRRLLDIFRFPFQFLNNFRFDFELPFASFPRISRNKMKIINFSDVEPGTTKYYDDGNVRSMTYRSKDGKSSGMSVSSVGGSGFAMAGSWPAGNFIMAQSHGDNGHSQVLTGSGPPFFSNDNI